MESERQQDRWTRFLPGPGTFLNPPGPREVANNLWFRIRCFVQKISGYNTISLIIPLKGHIMIVPYSHIFLCLYTYTRFVQPDRWGRPRRKREHESLPKNQSGATGKMHRWRLHETWKRGNWTRCTRGWCRMAHLYPHVCPESCSTAGVWQQQRRAPRYTAEISLEFDRIL